MSFVHIIHVLFSRHTGTCISTHVSCVRNKNKFVLIKRCQDDDHDELFMMSGNETMHVLSEE